MKNGKRSHLKIRGAASEEEKSAPPIAPARSLFRASRGAGPVQDSLGTTNTATPYRSNRSKS